MKKLLVCLLFIFSLIPTTNAVTLLRDTYTIAVIANNKDFFSTYLSITVDGKKYPFYVHDMYGKKLISAYGFGQIAAELIEVEGISEQLAEKLGIDSVTFYPDLGITLFEDDPYEMDSIYLRLLQEPAVKYAEISLIEIPISE